MKAKEITKTYFRPLFVGAAIFVVLVLHFAVSQFIAFDSEKNSSVSELIVKKPVEIKPEYKEPEMIVKTSADTTQIKTVEPKPEQKSAPKQQKVVKQFVIKRIVIERKEQPRETRAERLRRAEKILTGV